jgi:hypothetical protein
MTDKTEQQNRPSTSAEDIRELFSRTAKLNDAVSALLAPAWGSEAGIIPADHPLHPARQSVELEVVRDDQLPGAMHELAAAIRDLTSTIRLEIADRQPPAKCGAPNAIGTQHCTLIDGHDGRHGEGISSWPRTEADA